MLTARGHAERFRPECRRRFCQLRYLANCRQIHRAVQPSQSTAARLQDHKTVRRFAKDIFTRTCASQDLPEHCGVQAVEASYMRVRQLFWAGQIRFRSAVHAADFLDHFKPASMSAAWREKFRQI